MPRISHYIWSLFALSASSLASAQSSVTLFGVMDAGVSRYMVRSNSWDGSGRTASQGIWALSPSGNLASRLGVRAVEDLGAGMSVSMWLEAPVTNDTGGGALNFGRRSTVSLAGNWGELRLGRDHTPSFLNDWAFDPYSVNGVGVNLLAVVSSNLAINRALSTQTSGTLPERLLGNGLSAGTDNYLRANNSIGYHLPTGLGGIYGQLMYAFPENDARRGRYAGGRIGWASGPTDIALGYGESMLGTFNGRKETIKSLNLGGSYNFGPVRVLGEWSQVRNARSDVRATDRYDGFLAGVQIPVGLHQLRASVARVQFKNGQGTGDASVNKLALGYVHNLSKRTALYTTVSRISVSNGHNNPAVMGVTPLAVSSPVIMPQPAYSNSPGMQPRSALGFDAGLRMMF